MTKYYYARVSSKDQNLARQITAARELGIEDTKIFIDKASGKDFARPGYQSLRQRLQRGDELWVHDLDRLGRNKQMQMDELRWLRANGIIVRIESIPTTLIDFGEQGWIGEMVTNLLIEVMSSVAEQERFKILQRQKEGLEAMPIAEDGRRYSAKTGRAIGRVAQPIPEESYAVFEKVMLGEMGKVEAMKLLGIGTSRFYKHYNRFLDDRRPRRK